VAYGTANKRKQIINGEYDFIITNYEGVGILRNEILNNDFDLIVVDEANAYKSTSTIRWKTLYKTIKPDNYLWLLTGTPASQSPIDAFGLARLVSPHRVPKYATAWRDRVMLQVSRFTWIPKTTSKADVFYALQPAIRYSKKECLDLPEVLYQIRETPLTSQALKYYKELRDEMLVETGGEQVSAVNAAAKLSKLLQVSGGAVYSDEKAVLQFDIKPRLNALMEVIDQTENKILIFVPFRHTIKIVSEYLSKEKVKSEIINGDVTANNRSIIINKFQNEEQPKVLIIQPQSASHGVTLTAADTVIFWSPVMSVETYLQCIARIDRVGQKNNMTVVHLQGSEVERKMYKLLQNKVNLHTELVKLYQSEIGENNG
jgi:SNF2 family DNA or RNA helicase